MMLQPVLSKNLLRSKINTILKESWLLDHNQTQQVTRDWLNQSHWYYDQKVEKIVWLTFVRFIDHDSESDKGLVNLP